MVWRTISTKRSSVGLASHRFSHYCPAMITENAWLVKRRIMAIDVLAHVRLKCACTLSNAWPSSGSGAAWPCPASLRIRWRQVSADGPWRVPGSLASLGIADDSPEMRIGHAGIASQGDMARDLHAPDQIGTVSYARSRQAVYPAVFSSRRSSVFHAPRSSISV
jgi:hypothetical protein